MNTAEVNIDRLVDYKSEYWAYVKKPHISGHELTGLCPFHDDRNNSFSVDLRTGMWKCHAEDRGGNFISFYAEIHGVDTKEAYKQILEKYGVSIDKEKKEVKGFKHCVFIIEGKNAHDEFESFYDGRGLVGLRPDKLLE